MKKKFVLILLMLTVVLSMTACGVEIEDTNGPDDYTPATITDEDITSQSYVCSSYSMSPSSEDDAYLVEMTKFKSNNFSGVAELYVTDFVGKSDVMIDVTNMQVDSGNFRLLAVLDDEIVHEFEIGEMTQSVVLEDMKGTFRLMMAGESAEFEFYIQMW